jgi:hypothetical protein
MLSLAAGKEPHCNSSYQSSGGYRQGTLYCIQSIIIVIKTVINDSKENFPKTLPEGFDQHNSAVILYYYYYLVILKLNT